MIKRRFVQGLLILALLCGAVLLAHPSAAWAMEGTGLKDDPYQISTAADLQAFADKVNRNGETAACALLMGDIVLNEKVLDEDGNLNESAADTFTQWTPIGDGSKPYVGTFDGQGHTIKGLFIDSNAGYVGLFGRIGNGGTVQNLTLADSTIRISRSDSTAYVGGICGYNDGTIQNCCNSVKATATVTGSSICVGGICGYNNNGSITSCSNSGNVTGSGSSVTGSGSTANVGGICGENWGSIENCSNSGSVEGSSMAAVGGICGRNRDSITNCSNSGDVSGGSVGGICGICAYNDGSITNCSNSGSVTGTVSGTYVGGICGYNNGGSITSCSNSGNVSGPVTGNTNVGGICGLNRGSITSGTITNCSNSGPVTVHISSSSSTAFVGGICGYHYEGSITNCYWLSGTAGEGSGGGSVSGEAIKKNAEDYASGEVAWLLNQWQDDDLNLNGKVWAVGKDGYPVLNGKSDNIVVKLTFNANTGKEEEQPIIRYGNVGDALPKVTLPEITGYTFGGWYDNEALSGEPETAIPDDATGAKTYYAKWTANTYKVTLNTKGGTIVDGKDVTNYTYGIATALPTEQDITRTGYTFDGWYEDENFSSSVVTVIPDNATGAKTYYAKWAANTYKVTLNTKGGTIADGKDVTNYTYGTEITLPTDVTRAGYTFGGWYENEALSGEPETVIPADATGAKEYWAKWTAKSYPSAPPTVSEETTDAIQEAQPGETVTVDLSSGSTKLDKEVFENLAGRDVTLVVDLGDGVSWTVKGTDIPEDADFTDIDMGVTMNSDGIPVEVVNAITGERDSVQLELAHNGAFGFTMTLTAPLGAENAGLWANLYHFDEDANAMTFETAAPIGSDGSVSLSLSHASQYAIVIDDHNHGVVTLPFTDVSDSDWFYDPVCFVYENGLMTGTSATTFEPNTSLSRAMLVAVLHRLEGSPAASAGDFTDVAEGDWYAQAVNWAASVGVVNGMGDGTFQPNAAITREQLAAILRNYAAYKGLDVTAVGDLSTYSDAASVSDWAKDSVVWAVGSGLLGGYEDNTLRPQGTTTRAEVASVLQRYLEK